MLFPILVLGIPLCLFFDYDFWDGTRIAFAQETNDFSFVKDWFFSASVETQYFQEYAVNKFSDLININPLIFEHFLVVIAVSLLTREVIICGYKYFQLENEDTLIAALIISIFPAWSLTVSSVLTFYMTALAVGILSCRGIFAQKVTIKILSFFGLIYSFDYGVMLLLCPTLISCYFLILYQMKFNLKNLFFLLFGWILSFTYKLLQIFYAPPSGLMTSYNSIKFPIKFETIQVLFLGIKSYSSFILIPILVLLPLYLYSFTVQKKIDLESSHLVIDIRKRIGVVLVLLSSILPYLAVGKSTSLFWIDFWTGRHSFALVFPIALFSSLNYSFYKNLLKPNLNYLNIIFISTILIVFILLTSLLFRDLNNKFVEMQFRKGIISTLQNNTKYLRSGILNLKIEGRNGNIIIDDEANYIVYKARGKSDIYAQISRNSDMKFSKVDLDKIDKKLQNWDLYFPNKIFCETNILMRENFDLDENFFKKFSRDLDVFDIIRVEYKC